ncbi:MAG: DNA repair protein RadA [Bacteroidetes bacterium]|nr:DNA repair protein RadA [Bacteroidota bacterium]
MAKTKTVYICSNCEYKAVQWTGKCPSCNAWNSFEAQTEAKTTGKTLTQANSSELGKVLQKFDEFDAKPAARYVTYDGELNRVLGGGIVPGSITLLGGEPGIGKSTLLLQLALSVQKLSVLYVSGEESIEQVKLRASRIGQPNALMSVLAETDFGYLEAAIKEVDPKLIIIDSIQTLHSPTVEQTPGSIPQIRECTHRLMEIAKKQNRAIFIIGHITKDGYIAGPKILEHMVDVVLYFEGDNRHHFRVLRSSKNRFGSTGEIGLYEMQGSGLNQVQNPSGVLLGDRHGELSGIAIGCTLEGIRPMLIEIQALVSPSQYSTPQRSSTGFDPKRLGMLIAVLEKRCGLKIGLNDVFLNVTGGIKVADPAIDLAVIMALASSYFDEPLSSKSAFIGEVGLSGEIRKVPQAEKRLKECEQMGFNKVYTHNLVENKSKKLKITGLQNVMELIRSAFK